MPLEEAMRYPAALEAVRLQAKEARENSTSYSRTRIGGSSFGPAGLPEGGATPFTLHRRNGYRDEDSLLLV